MRSRCSETSSASSGGRGAAAGSRMTTLRLTLHVVAGDEVRQEPARRWVATSGHNPEVTLSPTVICADDDGRALAPAHSRNHLAAGRPRTDATPD